MVSQSTLENSIKAFNEAYRNGEPQISDADYDKLIDDLKQNYPDSKLLRNGVIGIKKISRKEKLPLPMYSLDKCKSVEEIKKWLKSNNVSDKEYLVITPKYDGISLLNEELEGKCWTRGDGEYGQRSDRHLACTNSSGYTRQLTTFGEAIMSKKNFQQYKGEFANPRNMVAGLFNRDIAGEALKHVDYIRYGVDREDMNKLAQLVLLNDINNVSVPFIQTNLLGLTESKLDELFNQWSEDYQIDGLVIDINDSDLRRNLGREENMNPKYARAYKNPKWSQSAIVKVTGVEWQVSKQGKLKPVIQIEPTELAGVTISNVTGYNAKYVFDNYIAPDSFIEIIRSGDVIPKHLRTVNYSEREFEIMKDSIDVCPCCSTLLEWDETETELLCKNPNCKDKKIMKLVHFFSTLEIEEFGEPSIKRFYEAEFDTADKILRMDSTDMVTISGFGVSSSSKLLKQFEQLREVGKPFAQIIDAYDVMQGKLGEKTIQLIFDNIDEDSIFQPEHIDRDSLIKIKGVAEVTATIFKNGMIDFWDLEGFREPQRTYLQTPKIEATSSKYEGMKICFTGCRPSKEQEQGIKLGGGEIVSGVSSKTTHLIVKNKGDKESSKSKKALSLGVKIISIQEFLK